MLNGILKKGDHSIVEPNSHKYLLKNKENPTYKSCKKMTINVSRSIGNSGNWIGCGSINKSGTEMDHHDIYFPFYSLVYVVQGQGTYIDEHQKSHLLKSGSLFQRRPERKHSTITNPACPWKEYYIDFNKEFYEHLFAIGLIEKDIAVYQVTSDRSISADFENLIEQLNQSIASRLPDIVLNFLSVFRNLINQSNISKSNEDLNDMIERSCIEFNRFFDKRIDLKEYCNTNGWGYESFRKAFKNKIGISPGKYIIRRRMDQACRILRSTNLRISEISEILGYKSQYEFSNQFKAQFDVFPKHFRDGIRKEGI